LVPKSVTLNDLERRNNALKAITMLYFTEMVAFRRSAARISSWKIHRNFLRWKCSPIVFSDILLLAIFAEITENECVMHIKRSHVSSLPLLQHYLPYSLLFSNSTASLIHYKILVSFRFVGQ